MSLGITDSSTETHAKPAGLLSSDKHRFARANQEAINPYINIHCSFSSLLQYLSQLDMVMIHHLLSEPTPLQ